jgi:hypothetical protein
MHRQPNLTRGRRDCAREVVNVNATPLRILELVIKEIGTCSPKIIKSTFLPLIQDSTFSEPLLEPNLHWVVGTKGGW